MFIYEESYISGFIDLTWDNESEIGILDIDIIGEDWGYERASYRSVHEISS